MQDCETQAKILAEAVYEIRLLLSGYLGSQNPGDPLVRQAAHLAYAIHNEALAVIEGKTFDTNLAISKIEGFDKMFARDFAKQMKSRGSV